MMKGPESRIGYRLSQLRNNLSGSVKQLFTLFDADVRWDLAAETRCRSL